MTATIPDLSWLASFPGRCPKCLMHVEAQGHAAVVDGRTTGCTPSGPLGLLLARRDRDAGMARTVEAHPSDATRVDEVLNARIRRGGEFSLNDLRHELAGIESKSVIGARVQAFARAKRIVRVGYEPSTDVGTHGHPVARWRAVA